MKLECAELQVEEGQRTPPMAAALSHVFNLDLLALAVLAGWPRVSESVAALARTS